LFRIPVEALAVRSRWGFSFLGGLAGAGALGLLDVRDQVLNRVADRATELAVGWAISTNAGDAQGVFSTVQELGRLSRAQQALFLKRMAADLCGNRVERGTHAFSFPVPNSFAG